MLDVCTRTWDLLSPCMAKQDFTSLLVQQGLPDSILPMMTEPCWNLFLPSLSPCIGIFGKLIYAHKGSKFSFFLWQLEAYYRLHNSPPVDSDLCRRSQIHIRTPCECRMHVNFISPCTPNIWHGSFPSYLSIKFSAVRGALSSYHIHLVLIIIVVHIELCNLWRSGHFSSWACYIPSLRYGRLRQHPVLEHPQAALLS